MFRAIKVLMALGMLAGLAYIVLAVVLFIGPF